MIKTKKLQFKLLLLILVITILPLFLLGNYAKLSNNLKKNKNLIDNPIQIPLQAIQLDWEETILNVGDDSGNSIVMGENGSVYVAGKLYNQLKGNTDAFITKYNSSGAQIWNKTFSVSTFEAIAHGIDYDLTNHYIYITGYAKNTTSNANLFLLKYDKDGNYCWNRTWGSDLGDAFDCGYSVKVNSSN